MKKFSRIYFVSAFLLSYFFGMTGMMAQQFNLYGIDASGFPTIKGNVYTKDPTGKDYLNLTVDNFSLWENGVSMKASLLYECKKVLNYQPVAVNLVLDNSSSMQDIAVGTEKRIEWVKQGAKAFLDSIHLDPPSVVSMIRFSGTIFANSDFQATKAPLYQWITDNLKGDGGLTTNFGNAYLTTQNILGSIPSLARTDKNLRRISILLSDGDPVPIAKWTPEIIDSIITTAKREKVQIYAIFMFSPMNSDLDYICKSTGGTTFSVYTKAAMMDAFHKIIGEIQSQNICQLVWTSPFGCDSASRYRDVRAVFNYKSGTFVDSVKTNYVAPPGSIASISPSQKQLKFGTIASGTIEQPVTLTAGLADYTVTGFTLAPNNGKYTIDWNGKTLPFVITKGTNHIIKVKYIESPSTASQETMLELTGNPCPVEQISLIAPCGGTFTASLDFSNVSILTTKDIIQANVFTNNTPVDITGDAQIAGTNKTEFDIVAGKGPFTLKPGASLDVTVRFSPDATPGTKSAYIDFSTLSDCGVAHTNLTGIGVKTDLPMPTMDWKERRLMTKNDSVYTVTNLGSTSIKILSIKLKSTSDTNFVFLKAPPATPLTVAAGGKVDLDVKFTPLSEGMLENFIEFDVENSGIVSGRLTGIGILPKILAPDVNFPPTKVLTNSAPVNLVITNPSTTADLYVKTISMNTIQNDFKFAPTAITSDFKVLKNNGTFNVPIIFTPQMVGLREISIVIECDAHSGKESVYKDSVKLSGIGIGLDITPTIYTYGNVLTCVTKDQPFTIDNTAGTAALTITSATITGAPAGAFTIVNPTMNSIAQGAKGDIIVRFAPTTQTAYSGTLQVRTSNGDADLPLTGTGIHVTVKPQVLSDPTRKILPGNADTLKFRFPVPDLQGANASDISAVLTFKGESLSFENKANDFKSPVIAGWNWTVTPSAGKITINGKGPAITTPRNLDFEIMLKTFLGDKSRSVINITPVFTGLSCVDAVTDSSVININTCYTEGRLITISKNKYSLHEINPSPVNSDNVNISYSIAIEAGTKLDLYNAFGVKVQSVVNEVQQNGTYEVTVPIIDIANGVYFVRLESGPYTETRQIVIYR